MFDKPFSPKENIERIRPFLPTKYSPINAYGDGNQGCYLASINNNLADELLSISGNQELAQYFLEEKKVEQKVKDEIRRIRRSGIRATEKQQLIQARLGQGVYRKNLLDIERVCRLTHVDNVRLLIASHIKPWVASSDVEKLDGNNGLLLSPHVDKLFDIGFITFTDDGYILRADPGVDLAMKKWGLDPNMNIGEFNSEQKKYIKHHRKSVYKGKNCN